MSNYSEKGYIINFKEYMDILVGKSNRFAYKLLTNSGGNVTGYICTTSLIQNDFYIFWSLISINYTKRVINKWFLHILQ